MSFLSFTGFGLTVIFFPLDILKTLMGDDNARRGVIKSFEVLQNKNLNKHLVYVSCQEKVGLIKSLEGIGSLLPLS